MKKVVFNYVRIILVVMLMCIMHVTGAQGLLSNTRQSAQYVRMLSRNASTIIDAVYYNPAGLSALSDGWHFAVNNQAVFQTNTITNGYPVLTDGVYTGKNMSPLIPSVFGAYKTGNVAFSLGATISAGEGLMTYERGLPSFEIPLSRMVPDLTVLSTLPFSSLHYELSGYAADINYKERTYYPGIQAGITYRFNEVLSGFAGLRYIFGSGTYEGYIRDVKLIVGGEEQDASDWLSGTVLPEASGLRTSYSSLRTSVNQLITAGVGNYTIAQVQTAGYITSAQRANYEAALSTLGLTSAAIAGLNIYSVYSRFSSAVTSLNSAITQITAASNTAADREMDVRQTGAGWTPIIGMNLNVSSKVNLGMKYEFKTRLAAVNSTTADDFDVYLDGDEWEISIPALLAIGIGYKPMDLLEAQLSFNLIFDKSENWGLNIRDQVLTGFHDIREREVEKNTWELALGLQYSIRNELALSIGGLIIQPGVADSYQCDFGYVSPSVTVGAGIEWKITDLVTLDAGIMSTFYQSVDLTYFDVKLQEWNDKYPTIYSGNNYVNGEYTEKLDKYRLAVSAGLTYRIFK